MIYRYDVAISPSEKTVQARVNMDLIKHVQQHVAPDIFDPPAVNYGKKNMFVPRLLPFVQGALSQEFDVSLNDPAQNSASNVSGRGPKIYKAKLTKIAEINPVVLQRFIGGQQPRQRLDCHYCTQCHHSGGVDDVISL